VVLKWSKIRVCTLVWGNDHRDVLPRLNHWIFTVFLTLAIALWAVPAFAWTEARPSGLVTEVTIDNDGGATVAVRVRWTVLGGRMHQYELTSLPNDLTLIDATAVAGNGTTVAVTAETSGTGRLNVNLGDETHGVRRGTVDVTVRYTTSLRAMGMIRRAANDAVVEVVTVPWARGLEGAEIRVALPSSMRRAQWIADDTPGVESSTRTELSRDVVHALRRHLPAGERWTARIAVDPATFPWLSASTTHRPTVIRRVRMPYDVAALLALGLALALGLFARYLANATTPGEGGGRIRRFAPALGALGAVVQSLHVLRVPGVFTGGTALLIVAAGAMLPRTPQRVVSTDIARTLHERDIRSISLARYTALRAVALALAFAGVVTSLAAAAIGIAWITVVSIDVALCLGAWVAWTARIDGLPDAAVLLPVVSQVSKTLRSGDRTRISWRARGDLRAHGALAARLVARSGWCLARGARSVELGVRDFGGSSDRALAPTLTLRFDTASPIERYVRSVAVRAGTLRSDDEGRTYTWSAALVGPESDVALAGLRDMMSVLFVKSTGREESQTQREAQLADTARV
jgi:hypothetical protein